MSDVSSAFRTQAEADFEFIVIQEFNETVTHTARSDDTETSVNAIVERFPDEFETRENGRVRIQRRAVHVSKDELAAVDETDMLTIDSANFGIESIMNEYDLNSWEIRAVRIVRETLQASETRKITL